MKKLTAAFIRTAPAGKHGDGGGLQFHKRRDGGAQWVLRYTVHGRRREMGLGGYPALSLAEAREQAARWRAVVAGGDDPIKRRAAEQREARRAENTLAAMTADCFEARRHELRDDGAAGRWLTPLKLHVLPKLGAVPVTALEARDLRDVLRPLWHAKFDTARKALSRVSIVLKHAAALGLDVDLQAVAKARALLGRTTHVATNIPAMPWQDVPGFYATLAEPTAVNLALRLLILSGMRSRSVRHARVQDFDLEARAWTIPGEDMKGLKGRTSDFRAALSSEAVAVVQAALPFARNGLLIPGLKGGPLSDMALSQHMRRRGLEAKPHGFRTSLRTWLSECTNAPHEVAEAVIAHKADSSVVRAYRRTDWLEQRQVLLQRWADHVTGKGGAALAIVGA